MKPADLTGRRFGKLVAIACVGSNNQNRLLWLCQCDCGGTSVVASHNLMHNKTKSCGCKESKVVHPGEHYGEWTVIGQTERNSKNKIVALCRCSCGKEKPVIVYSLINGMSKSCGHSSTQHIIIQNYAGKKFGMLTAIRQVGVDEKGIQIWECKCSCGNPNKGNVSLVDLLTGKVKSCGCKG